MRARVGLHAGEVRAGESRRPKGLLLAPVGEKKGGGGGRGGGARGGPLSPTRSGFPIDQLPALGEGRPGGGGSAGGRRAKVEKAG